MKSSIANLKSAIENKIQSARQNDLRNLSNIEHRLEFVENQNGVVYVNDAKSTDPNSTWYSIDALQGPIVWIACSSEFDDHYELFDEFDTTKIRIIIVMGSAKERFIACFQDRVELIGQVKTLDEAVHHARLIANAGDVVLYSPSCFNHELFQHYKEAGQQFRKAVRETLL